MKNRLSAGVVGLYVLAFGCTKKLPDPVIMPEQPPVAQNNPVDDPSRLLPSQLPVIGYPMFFTGDTVFSSSLRPQDWFAVTMDKVDLGSLAQADGPPDMIAFGGGLTAGVSNGGLNREAQQFAYPNLVAHQMGLVGFKTPLLPEEEANGPGIFLEENPKGAYPRWKEVSNHLAKLTAAQPVKMTPYDGLINNFAYPATGVADLNTYQCETCVSTYSARFNTYKRTGDSTLLMVIRARQDYDFVMMENFFDAYVQWVTHEPKLDETSWPNALFETQKLAMEDVLTDKIPGVVFTIPHFRHFGFVNWYDAEKLRKAAGSLKMTVWRNGMRHELTEKNHFYLKPTTNVENLFIDANPGKQLDAVVNDLDVIDETETFIANPDRIMNPSLRAFAKEHNLALVDLHWIFEQIHLGKYVTDDGLKIDGSRSGNFFSSDGVYPTPVGQAVIANEVIRAINLKYGAKIPLINVTQFAHTIGVK